MYKRQDQAYAITKDDAEMERLVNFARAADAHARDGLGRVGLGEGCKAIDIGCGPIGALLTLAELCGPGGMVLGLDVDTLSLRSCESEGVRRWRDGTGLIAKCWGLSW